MKKNYATFLVVAGIIATFLNSPMAMADSVIVTYSATGHKYQRIDQYLTWAAARDYCKNIVTPTGAYLVTITNQLEQNFVSKLLGHGSSWIGASDSPKPGVWNWVSTTEEFTWTYWAAGQPNPANGHYAFMSSGQSNDDYHWNTADGTNPTITIPFICEWGGSAYKNYVDSAFLDDMNANTFPEIATLYTDLSTGQVSVKIQDSSTKAVISTVNFGVAKKSFPQSMAIFSNTTQSISVLLIDKLTLKATQEIRDAATGALISSVPF